MNRVELLAQKLNEVRLESTSRYQDVVPELMVENGTIANFTDLTNVMTNRAFTAQFNEFLGNLINRIGLTLIDYMEFSNPLAIFKKEVLESGDVVQRVFTNPATADDLGGVTPEQNAKVLGVYTPDTKAAYIRINRGEGGNGDIYKVTISRQQARRAFVSPQSLIEFLDSTVSTLVEGNEDDEYKYTKTLIGNAVKENKVVINPVATGLTTVEDLTQFVVDVKTLAKQFKFRSSAYNAFTHFEESMGNPARVVTPLDRLSLIIESNLMAKIDVEVLAAAFNMDKAEFMGRVVEVDTFQDVYPGLRCIVCDDRWLSIHDHMIEFDGFHNAFTGSDLQVLRVNGAFGIVPWQNAVALVDEDKMPSIDATAVEVSAYQTTPGSSLNFRFAPANATDTVEIVESDGTTPSTLATVDNATRVITVGKDTGTFVVKAVTSGDLSDPVVIA